MRWYKHNPWLGKYANVRSHCYSIALARKYGLGMGGLVAGLRSPSYELWDKYVSIVNNSPFDILHSDIVNDIMSMPMDKRREARKLVNELLRTKKLMAQFKVREISERLTNIKYFNLFGNLINGIKSKLNPKIFESLIDVFKKRKKELQPEKLQEEKDDTPSPEQLESAIKHYINAAEIAYNSALRAKKADNKKIARNNLRMLLNSVTLIGSQMQLLEKKVGKSNADEIIIALLDKKENEKFKLYLLKKLGISFVGGYNGYNGKYLEYKNKYLELTRHR